MGREDGEGERTRFPCLATVRLLVAAVVAVLAVVMVAIVISVLHRPEEIRLSTYGYVETQQNWWSDVAGHTAPATSVEIEIILFANNPSGRGEAHCDVNRITIFDMPSWRDDMVLLKRFVPTKPLDFSVPTQTWESDRTSENITDPVVLRYLYDEHEYDSSFSAMVQVDMTLRRNNGPIGVTYYCWPVFVAYGWTELPGDEVYCKERSDMDYFIPWSLAPQLAPAPAPAPAPGITFAMFV